MGKLPIKGIFPIISKGNDFKWWGQNTDRKSYVGFTYNIPIWLLGAPDSQKNKSACAFIREIRVISM